MTTNNQLLTDYVYLAEASYADFSPAYRSDTNAYDENRIKQSIYETEENGGVEKPQNFAELVANNYSVEAHYKDRTNESSFSGTLFKNKDTGKYVLALKGTQELPDDLFVTDISDIIHDGLAHKQIVDMYNFWQQINANKGQSYQVATIKTDTRLTELYDITPSVKFFIEQNLEGQGYFIDSGEVKQIIFKDSHEVYAVDDDRYNGLGINPEKVTVTGHSLGGHLTAAFSRLFPNDTEHAYMVNGAGFGSPYNFIGEISTNNESNISEIFSTLGGRSTFDTSKITNLIGDKNVDVVANDWLIGLQQPGAVPELFIEELKPLDPLEHLLGHSSDQMSDTMAVIGIFTRLDLSLANKPVAELLNLMNNLFKASDVEDKNSLENIVEKIYTLLSGDKTFSIFCGGERCDGGIFIKFRTLFV